MIQLADSGREAPVAQQVLVLHQFPVFAEGLVSKLNGWGYQANAILPQELHRVPASALNRTVIFADGIGLKLLMSGNGHTSSETSSNHCMSQTVAILSKSELTPIYRLLPVELTRIVSPKSSFTVYQTAIEKTVSNSPFVDPLLDDINDQHCPRLTPRQMEVLDLITDGLTSRAIGSRLGISPRTAEKHRANIKAALNADSIIEIILYGQRLKFAA